jgi:hypothetical protein
MIPEWAEKYLGEDGVADIDPRSGEPVAWGRQVISQIPEGLFDKLRGEVDLVCIHPGWYVIERRIQYDEIAALHGGVKTVGVGPSGGFKWVQFADGTLWGHKYFRDGSMKEAVKNARLVVKCDKDGNEKGVEPRLPRLTVGYRPGKSR